MIRTFFAGLGVIFALLIVFCASFLGRLAVELEVQRAANEHLAVSITRDLSRDWSIKDIRAHYSSSVSHRIGASSAQSPFDTLRPLGPLRYVDDAKVDSGLTQRNLRRVGTPADAAGLLAEILNKTVRVTFLAKFANGFARVTVELRNEGGTMKLWHLQIDSQEPLQNRTRRRPQAISHA
jgi:hypothetical protein